MWAAIRPALQVREDVKELKDHDRKDYETLRRLDKMNHMQCKALLRMMNHIIEGNHIEKMKETRDEIMENRGER